MQLPLSLWIGLRRVFDLSRGKKERPKYTFTRLSRRNTEFSPLLSRVLRVVLRARACILLSRHRDYSQSRGGVGEDTRGKGFGTFASFVLRLSRLSYLGSFAVSCTLFTFRGVWLRPHPPLPRIIAYTRSMHMRIPKSLFLYSPITYPFAAPSPLYNLVGRWLNSEMLPKGKQRLRLLGDKKVTRLKTCKSWFDECATAKRH